MAQSRGGSRRSRGAGRNAQKARSSPPRKAAGSPPKTQPGRAPAAQPSRGLGSRPGRGLGSRPGRLGVAIVAAGAAAGAILTMLTGSEPGLLLGLFLVAATIVGALVVATSAAYVVIPVPAIAYPLAALLAGYVHDHAVDTSLTGLAVSAVQWIASGFIAMTAATVIAIALSAGRYMFDGPGGRLAYRDTLLRGARWPRYRGSQEPAPAGGKQREPEGGNMPAGSRRTG